MKYRGFDLDPFQATAIGHLMEGRSVLVSAPTGNGKTIIADWIVEEAFREGKEVIYTAPVKALSNQKYRDYTRLYGADRVGLVTGDLVINPGAPCRVMTTEILRNMLLAGQELHHLLAVVIDEIHFLDDRERGTVWEEVLIYLPKDVLIVGLSATLSNLDQFAAWLRFVREGPVEVVRAEERIVPLTFYYAARETGMRQPGTYHEQWKRKRFRFGEVQEQRRGRGRRPPPRRGRPVRHTRDTHLFHMLDQADMLPYLYFVFSRKDTELFARGLSRHVEESLLGPGQQAAIDERLLAARSELGPAMDRDLEEMYRKGIAFHHAGLHVQLKALVEELYESRLLLVLYCTSTFALGINMPARSVVFDGVMKFDGQKVAPLTTRGFMQKAGRAGRRGMDQRGHVVVRVELEEYERLRPLLKRYQRAEYEPVRSSFSLSWNSVVNLIGRLDEAQIRAIVDKSFLSWHLANRGKGPGPDRVWGEFQEKVGFLRRAGYLDADNAFNAGAKALQHLQIEEILVTELLLAGILDPLEPTELFGVLCALTNELGRNVERNFQLRKSDRALARAIEAVRDGWIVREAEELSGAEVVWDPDLLALGRAWAEGRSLQEVLMLVISSTDISGDLVTGFRRAKDLAGQLREVWRDVPDKVDTISTLIRTVSRDEVEVID